MKVNNKFVAIFLACILVFALSTVAYAAEFDRNANYKMALVADEITQGTTEVSAKVVLFNEDAADDVIDVAGGSASIVNISFTYPNEFSIADESSIVTNLTGAEMDTPEFDNDQCYVSIVLKLKSTVQLTKDTAICEIKFNVPSDIKVGDYEFISDEGYNSAIDSNGNGTGDIASKVSIITVKAATPVVKTYKVTFTNYSENDKTVNENEEITLPAAPAVGENEVFNGWNDGEKTYAAGAKYTVTKDVTFTADITTVVPQPTKAETKVESEKVRDLTYDTDKTSHFFEGIYSVTPNDEKIATFGVNVKSKANASNVKPYTKSGLTIEGSGKIVLRLALINDDVEILNDLTGEVFYTAE